LAYRASEKYKEGKSVIEKFYIEIVDYSDLREAKLIKATTTVKSEQSHTSLERGYLSTSASHNNSSRFALMIIPASVGA
jgi:hypothetical protein